MGALLAAAGCGGGSSKAAGTVGGACYPNGTCNTSLTCLSNVCVDATGVGGKGGGPGGATGAGGSSAAGQSGAGGSAGAGGSSVAGQSGAGGSAGPGGSSAAGQSGAGGNAGAGGSSVAGQSGAAGGAFSPGQLPGLAVWLRGDKGVTADSNGVSLWADQSSNHDDFAAGTTPPALVTSGINGLPSIGAGSLAPLTGHATTIAAGAFTLEVVIENVVIGNQIFLTSLNGSGFSLVANGTGKAAATISPTAMLTGTVGITGSTPHIVGVVRDDNGNCTLRIDGAVDATFSGGRSNLGNFPSATLGGGTIAEMVIINGALTTQQTSDLEAYFKARYGL